MAKNKWNIVWGVVITMVFFGLLAARLELFQKKLLDNPITKKS